MLLLSFKTDPHAVSQTEVQNQLTLLRAVPGWPQLLPSTFEEQGGAFEQAGPGDEEDNMETEGSNARQEEISQEPEQGGASGGDTGGDIDMDGVDDQLGQEVQQEQEDEQEDEHPMEPESEQEQVQVQEKTPEQEHELDQDHPMESDQGSDQGQEQIWEKVPEQANIGLEGDFSMGHAGEEDARENVTAQGDGAQDDGSIGRHNEGGTPEGNTVQPSTLAFSSRRKSASSVDSDDDEDEDEEEDEEEADEDEEMVIPPRAGQKRRARTPESPKVETKKTKSEHHKRQRLLMKADHVPHQILVCIDLTKEYVRRDIYN